MSEEFLREYIGGSVDLGHEHYLHYYGWAPDRRLNPQYEGLPDVERLGATIIHRVGPMEPHPGYSGLWGVPGWCAGSVQFKAPETEPVLHVFHGATWDVMSWEPLHIEPSVLCACGDHGFIRNGRWQPA
jgi:hypothetical protein